MKMTQIYVSDEFLASCPALQDYLESGGPQRDEQKVWDETLEKFRGWDKKDGWLVMFTHPETGEIVFRAKPFLSERRKAVWVLSP